MQSFFLMYFDWILAAFWDCKWFILDLKFEKLVSILSFLFNYGLLNSHFRPSLRASVTKVDPFYIFLKSFRLSSFLNIWYFWDTINKFFAIGDTWKNECGRATPKSREMGWIQR